MNLPVEEWQKLAISTHIYIYAFKINNVFIITNMLY